MRKALLIKKNSSVNFCKKCDTVLANEQVHNGKCWRHEDTEVEIKQLEQWFFKITEYAEELLKDIENLDWPERIKIMQRNWIGKSEGSEIKFEINGKIWKVFTTRPDTLYGVTFMVVSAQHSNLMELVAKEQKKDVEDFLKKIRTTKQEDIDKLEKEGVFSGSYALHPLTKEKIPIWIGNFVLAEYGSGMVMGVPAHDQRDFDFAKKYHLPIKEVISGGDINKESYIGPGRLVNSGRFNDLGSREAKEHIINALKDKKLGKKTIQYKLRDWLLSRQRYWGTPIPILYCDKCGIQPVRERDLPVLLPEKVKFGKGNPLTTNKEFLNSKCPKCKGKATRETDTMDTFVDSSWYFLRFTDAKNKSKMFDKKKTDYWMPVDFYTGGVEHACMHLIYARFFTKVLRDLGFVGKNLGEPFKRLFNQGMVHGEDGFVMSKSRGNVVYLEKISDTQGIDASRLFLMSIASPDKDTEWNDKGVDSTHKFLAKTFDYFSNVKIGKSDERVESKVNKAIKEITEYIEGLKYNLAIIKLRSLFDYLNGKELSKQNVEVCIKLLSPFCPHVAEELWERFGNKGFVSLADWPKFNEKKINAKFEKEEESIRKIGEDIIHIKEITGMTNPKAYVYTIPSEFKLIEFNREFISNMSGSVVFPFSVDDKDKYDPENKSKKVKPGRPGIYLE